ncbi:MAG: hypothetical protein V1792_09955 [Pseudomonadota bacterium]
MQLRYLVGLSLVGVLLILTGCDPKKMIQQKVPDTVTKAMSSAKEGGEKGKGEQKDQAARIEITIVAPKRNSVYPANKEIEFEAKVEAPDDMGKKPEVTWKLYRGAAIKKGFQIGRGNRITKKVDAGQYKVSASLSFKNIEKIKTTAFRVANTIEGRITGPDDEALPDAQLVLSNIDDDKPLHQARSGRDGVFSVEVPADGFFKVIPKKEGYNFYPYRGIVKFTDPPVPVNFKGTKAQITDVKITEDSKGKEPLESVCPLQQGYVSFSVKSGLKPVSVETSLVGVKDGKEQFITMEDASDDPTVKAKIHPEGTVLKLQIPSTMAAGATGTNYRLRVTVQDEKRNQFSAEAPASLGYDILKCFRQALADGVEFQNRGKLEAAAKSYKLLHKLSKKVDDPSQFKTFIDQSTFNRGLAYLAMAEDKDKNDRETFLALAFSDFEATLRNNESDLDARLFMGLTLQLAGRNTHAEAQYDKVIHQEPHFTGVRELRALARLKQVEEDLKEIMDDVKRFGSDDIRELFTRLERRGLLKRSDTAVLKSGSAKTADRVNVLLKAVDRLQKQLAQKLQEAVDDFTEAVKSRPDDKNLRQSRRETLKIVHDLQENEADHAEFRGNVRKLLQREAAQSDLGHPALKVGISNIPRRDTAKIIDPGKYVRK